MRIELLLFLSFLVMIIVMIACSAPRRPTPSLSPTLISSLTLTTYNPQLIIRVSEDAAIAATISPASVRHSLINISPPRCFRTASPKLTCLGYIRNRGQKAISDITLKASFQSADGEPQGQQTFSLEQRRVAPEAAAPYRFQAPGARLETAALEIGLVSAQRSAPVSVILTVDKERGEYLAEQRLYRFTATLRNGNVQLARDIRLIVTLENAAGAIVGYRAADLPGELPSGGSVDVDMTITPLDASADMRHRVTLEALPAAQP